MPDLDRAPDRMPGVREDTFVTVVAVVDQSTAEVVGHVRSAHGVLNAQYANYELVLVDNGLANEQLADLRDVLHELPCIRIIRLSRRHSPDAAVFAGLEAAIGDFVITVTLGSDPIDVVAPMVAMMRDGSDVVQGISDLPDSGWNLGRVGRSVFYGYNRRRLGIDIPLKATSLIGLSRRAVNSLTNLSRNQRYLRHLIRHVGFRISEFHYEPVSGRDPRPGLVTEAVEMVSSYSTHPLRIVTIAGILAAVVNALYAIYVLIVNLVSASVERGWTSTSLQLSVMFFVVSVILAVQSEYIGRILTESRREPSYFVIEELESDTLLADLARRNVSD